MREGKRPLIRVLCDRGDGEPFDDPTGKAPDTYVRLLGNVVAEHLHAFKGPEIAGYLAAMYAERYDPDAGTRQTGAAAGGDSSPGSVIRRRTSRTTERRSPFSTDTLERGLRRLEELGLVIRNKTTISPTGAVLSAPGSSTSTGLPPLHRPNPSRQTLEPPRSAAK